LPRRFFGAPTAPTEGSLFMSRRTLDGRKSISELAGASLATLPGQSMATAAAAGERLPLLSMARTVK